TWSRITNAPISRTTPASRTIDTSGRLRRAGSRPTGGRGAPGALGPGAAFRGGPFRRRQPENALAADIRPARSAARGGARRARGCALRGAPLRPQDLGRGSAIGRRQPLAPRAEMRRARAEHDPADRPATARARLTRPLVDL